MARLAHAGGWSVVGLLFRLFLFVLVVIAIVVVMIAAVAGKPDSANELNLSPRDVTPPHLDAPRASRARLAMATIDRRTSSDVAIASSNASRAARGPVGVTAAISKPYRSTAVMEALVASAMPASPDAYASTASAWSSFMCRRISEAAAARQSGSAARYSSALTQDIRPNPPM